MDLHSLPLPRSASPLPRRTSSSFACRVGCDETPDTVVTRSTETSSTSVRRCRPHAHALFAALSPARASEGLVVTLGYAEPVGA